MNIHDWDGLHVLSDIVFVALYICADGKPNCGISCCLPTLLSFNLITAILVKILSDDPSVGCVVVYRLSFFLPPTYHPITVVWHMYVCLQFVHCAFP